MSWRAAYEGLLEDKVLRDLDPENLGEQWADRIAAPDAPGDRLWVLEHDDRIVGYTRFGRSRDGDRDPSSDAEVYGFYLHPEMWGSGGAALLFREILEDLRARGFVRASLWVAERNARARAFYAKQGLEHEPAIPARDCFGTPEIRYHAAL